MSQRNVEVARRAWEAVEGGDFEAALVARGRGIGIELDRLDAILYSMRGAKVVRLEYFNNRDQAFAALAPVA
jgi:hypothetical protein